MQRVDIDNLSHLKLTGDIDPLSSRILDTQSHNHHHHKRYSAIEFTH